MVCSQQGIPIIKSKPVWIFLNFSNAVSHYTDCAARESSLSTLLRFSRPFSDHGKCATGMRKKELLVSAIPARALYLEMVVSCLRDCSWLEEGFDLPRQERSQETEHTAGFK